MRRREFITLLGGAAAALPLAARAQQSERMRRVGVLMNFTSDDPVSQDRLAAFVQGLQDSRRESRRLDGRTGATCTSIIVLHPLRVPKKHRHLRRSCWRCGRT